jgi:DNA-binding NtrC family response regulator
VFLDEIGELPFKAQSKLLRVLQNHEIQRVGSAVLRNLEVRVIAATNRDLRSMVRDGKFREDLFYRLGVVEIHVPRLIERLSDLPLLQTYFVSKFAAQYKRPVTGMTRRAKTRLGEHSWPGNIRELENVIGHACMMAEGTVVDIKDLPHSMHGRVGDIAEQDEGMISLDELQKRYTMRVLEQVGGNKAQAAEILGISRATIYQFLAQRRAKAL